MIMVLLGAKELPLSVLLQVVARVSLDGFTSFHNQGNSPEPPSFDPRGVAPGKPGLPFIIDNSYHP